MSILADDWRREVFCHQRQIRSVTADTFPLTDYQNWRQTDYPEWLERQKAHLASESEYGTLFQYAHKTRDQRQMFVERLIEGRKPGLGYFYLAGLINSARFNTVLTTNFDDLPNDALVRYYQRKAIVCAFDSAVNSFSTSSLRPKIIKLHGDFLFDNVRNLDSETLDLGENMEEKLVEMCEDKGLIVVGYSGSDESIMAPLRENLRRNRKFLTKGVHWCVQLADDSDHDIAAIDEHHLNPKLVTLRSRYPGRVFLYRSHGFDQLMFDFFTRCDLDLPVGIAKPYSNNLAREFCEACAQFEIDGTLTPEMKSHRLRALDSLEEMPYALEVKLMRADTIFGEGISLRRRGSHRDAEDAFRQALHLAEATMVDELPAELQWLARRRQLGCYVALGKARVILNPENDCEGSPSLPSDWWNRAREICRTHALMVSGLELQYEGYTSSLYNALCACGLLWEGDEPTNDLFDDVRNFLDQLSKSNLGRRKLRKLGMDSDAKPIVNSPMFSAYFRQ
ncbi:MAG: SIR2 family protein [Egibacteraceae bacterium]